MAAYDPLTREEVASVIEGRSVAPRVPAFIHFWVHGKAFEDRADRVAEILSRYVPDVQHLPLNMPATFRSADSDSTYTWLPYEDPYEGRQVAHDARVAMADWTRLDEILASFPDPAGQELLTRDAPPDGRYRLGQWFFCLFERHWSLRGMTNALMDYYTNPHEVHRLFRALTDFYVALIERAGKGRRCDGIWTSDDLGTQTGPFFSPAIFREFYKPYYKEIVAAAHRYGMHLWMHACGNVEPFIGEWIDVGVDVLHPIQKHTMDEKVIAETYGHRITIFAGLDVQQVIPWGTPEQVRQEVRFLLDTFWRKGEGRCMITAGNGINGDCPLPSLEAFLDEAYAYGAKVASG